MERTKKKKRNEEKMMKETKGRLKEMESGEIKRRSRRKMRSRREEK